MKIALLGCGVVGGGVLDIVDKRSDLELKYVLVRRDKPELGLRAVTDINTAFCYILVFLAKTFVCEIETL